MTTKASKLLLLGGVAALYTIVVFNNLTDFNSNYQIVRHVLTMDTTFPNNHGMWRAFTAPAIQLAFYLCIIVWEIVTMALLWWGLIGLVQALRLPLAAFENAKRIPLIALTLSLLMWLVAFLAVGGEWFLMWQSHTWNGQDAAFRNFTVVGIVLLFLLRPETETQA
jgi:predicted small integral membrane protein